MSEVRDDRRAGWWWAHNDVIDRHGRDIGMAGFAVYGLLCRHANKQGQCWPSLRRLSGLLRMSPNTAQKALDRLQKVGLIRIDKRTDVVGRLDSSLYTLMPIGVSGVDTAVSPEPDSVCQGLTRSVSTPDTEQDSVKDYSENKKKIPPVSPLTGGTRAVKWKTVPEGERLTPERTKTARALGFPANLPIGMEWDKFADHEFRSPRTDVDKAWRNWVRGAVQRLVAPPSRGAASVPPGLRWQTAEQRQEAREDEGRARIAAQLRQMAGNVFRPIP